MVEMVRTNMTPRGSAGGFSSGFTPKSNATPKNNIGGNMFVATPKNSDKAVTIRLKDE